jgi:hypothetical protein
LALLARKTLADQVRLVRRARAYAFDEALDDLRATPKAALGDHHAQPRGAQPRIPLELLNNESCFCESFASCRAQRS